jgi:hypothetical protein
MNNEIYPSGDLGVHSGMEDERKPTENPSFRYSLPNEKVLHEELVPLHSQSWPYGIIQVSQAHLSLSAF